MDVRILQAGSLRERTRRAVRAELVAVGHDLFLAQGYEQTTVEQIATAAGMSERSFFRYFPSKDDLVMGAFDDMAERMAELFSLRPANESAWESLGEVLLAINTGRGPESNDPGNDAVDRIVRATPSLTARYLDKMSRMQQPLIQSVRDRLGSPDSDPRPAAIVGAAFACGMAAQQTWTQSEHTEPFERLLAQAMASVGAHPTA